MRTPSSYVRCFRFAVKVDGKEIGATEIKGIKADCSGRRISFGKVSILRAITEDSDVSLCSFFYEEVYGSFGKKTFEVEIAMLETGVVLTLEDCELDGYEIGDWDAMHDGLIMEKATIVPKTIKLRTQVREGD